MVHLTPVWLSCTCAFRLCDLHLFTLHHAWLHILTLWKFSCDSVLRFVSYQCCSLKSLHMNLNPASLFELLHKIYRPVGIHHTISWWFQNVQRLQWDSIFFMKHKEFNCLVNCLYCCRIWQWLYINHIALVLDKTMLNFTFHILGLLCKQIKEGKLLI